MNSNLEWSEITIGRIDEKIHLSSPNPTLISESVPQISPPDYQKEKTTESNNNNSTLPLKKRIFPSMGKNL
jgi:hypothetical protein